ncbi:MAG: hypothetical protein CL772_00595 [Chloroflexi bacterium]|nr:hypothetical protein [Chloroflexota bacterium]|tara:strand:+ start:26647 stop:27897 length:1251 start_codon:yes stop_codon:yes gene_type:complete
MIDKLIIKVKPGNGGKGSVSFNRDSNNSRGGPDGGNGGSGGNIILKANSNLSDLNKYSFQKSFFAENGNDGSKQKKSGSKGKNLTLDLPIGCLVWEISGENKTLVASILNETSEIELYLGGSGGKGNTSFVSSQNKEPLLAEAGQHSQIYSLELDYRINSDLLLLGLPNSGKSSFLSSFSNAKPEINTYPYTTREPVIAISKVNYSNIKIIELPSIDNGKGLGANYLKHLYFSKFVCLTVEHGENIIEQIDNLLDSISSFDENLLTKKFIVLISKSENVNSDEKKIINNKLLEKFPFLSTLPFYFSNKNSEKNKEILLFVLKNMSEVNNSENDAFIPTINLRNLNINKVKKTQDFYEILDRNFIQLAEGSDLSNWKALVQFQYKLKSSKISDELNNLGIKKGDKIKISNYEFTWEE